MEISEGRLKQAMELIDKIANSIETADDSLPAMEKQLREIAQKPDLGDEDCAEYWGWTSLKDLARRFLMPKAGETKSRAIPHNLTRADGEKIWIRKKALFRRNT